MHIDLLGPLRIEYENENITPSAPKLRQVFSLLALCANTVVPHDRFVEELWEDGPPTSVTTTLQTYIYQLRKVLPGFRGSDHGRGQHPQLQTARRGYTLLLPTTDLDSVRFEQMVRHGARRLHDGNPREAAAMLRDGLGLWRGPALSEVETGPILTAERLRLEQLRKTALEQRIEADLMLGRHYELIGELTALVTREPTNERLAGHLILALHRSQHRDQALRIYDHVRTNLVEQLGLDPSHELQQLLQAVLKSDESLLLAGVTAHRVVPQTPPPCQLPPRSGALIGRLVETATAHAALSAENAGPRSVLVTGPPGSGKTALTVQVAYDLRPAYPDGQLFASLASADGSRADTSTVLRRFLSALAIPPEQQPGPLEELMLAFRSHTADGRILVVLDDVLDPDQVSALTPVGANCGLLVAAHTLLRHPGFGPAIEVRPLGSDDAVAMLGTIVGEHRIHDDPETAKAIVERCDGLPAAVQACAQQLRTRPHWSLDRLLTWIDHDRTRNSLNLRASIERTYWSVSPEAREVFELFTVNESGPLSSADIAEALALYETEAEGLLETLAEAQLIDPSTLDGVRPPQYTCLHAIARAGARSSLACT